MRVRHGPQMAGSEAPKITTAGTPKAAAMWAGPESLPTNSAAPASSDLISASGAPARVRNARKGERSSAGAADEDRLDPRLLQVLRHRQKPAGAPGLIRP